MMAGAVVAGLPKPRFYARQSSPAILEAKQLRRIGTPDPVNIEQGGSEKLFLARQLDACRRRMAHNPTVWDFMGGSRGELGCVWLEKYLILLFQGIHQNGRN